MAFSKQNLTRVLDATSNRASEGLRVVEDYVRFILEDRFLTNQLKTIRHELAGAVRTIPASERLAMRDTRHDVGTTLSTPSEKVRADAGEVFLANLKRAQESVRSLEEWSKAATELAFPGLLSDRFEQIRYQLYSLEKSIFNVQSSCERLKETRLYVLIAGEKNNLAFTQQVKRLVAAGVDALQLRDKNLNDRELLERAKILVEHTKGKAVLSLINDRVDLAAASQADGVHLGQDELPVQAARNILGPHKLIGVSTHHLAQTKAAVLDGANYIGCGPTFSSTTKSFETFAGLKFLREVAVETKLPAFAIGGIHLQNLKSVLETGFNRVAVSATIHQAEDLQSEVQKFQQELQAFQATPTSFT